MFETKQTKNNMGFKKEAVIADVYEMGKGRVINVNSREGKVMMTDRIYKLSVAIASNSNYADKRRWVDIKWEETAKLQLEAGNLDWVEFALGEMEFLCKQLKRNIKFPVRDSYTEALEDGEELAGYNDYIVVLEADINTIKGIELKPAVKAVPSKSTKK